MNIFKRWPIPLYLMWIEQTVIFWIRIGGGGGVVGGPSPSSTFQLMSKLCRSFSIFDNYLLALLDSKPDQQHTFLFSGWEKGGACWPWKKRQSITIKVNISEVLTIRVCLKKKTRQLKHSGVVWQEKSNLFFQTEFRLRDRPVPNFFPSPE